jgi:excisionase family DNA binding protein
MAWRRDRRTAGARLRAFREDAGLSQLDLAASSGLTHEAISIIELGRRSPRAMSIERLARALSVAPEQFVTGELPTKYLTAREAAGVIGVSESTVRRWLKEGRLPTTKVAGRHRVPASVLRPGRRQRPPAPGDKPRLRRPRSSDVRPEASATERAGI